MYETNLSVEYVDIDELVMYKNNSKFHDSRQIDQIATSIKELGFNSPILAWHNNDGEAVIVAGHGRLLAAKQLGLKELPVIFLDHLDDESRRIYTLVDNQLTMNSGFDMTLLSNELDMITDIDMSQFDFIIDEPTGDDFGEFDDDEFEELPQEEKTTHQCPNCGFEW